MSALADAGIEAGTINGAVDKRLAEVYAALKETALNLEHAAEEAERAASRARERLESFEGMFDPS